MRDCRWTAVVMLRSGSDALVRLFCVSAAQREAHVVVCSSQMSVQSSITCTSTCTGRLFAHIGSNTGLLTASQPSEVIETQRTMANLLGISSNQWPAGGSETSHKSSDCVVLRAMHDPYDTRDTCDPQDVSLIVNIDKAKSIMFSCRCKTSATAGFQPTELHTTE